MENKKLCAKCDHSIDEHRGGKKKSCFHEDEYRPYGLSHTDPPKIIMCSCDCFLKRESLQLPSKPKTSTIDKVLKDRDLAFLSNQLLVLCGDYYEKMSIPQKYGGYRGNQNDIRDPEVLNEIKGKILVQAIKIGERLWYPRGNPGLTDTLNAERLSKTVRKRK